MLDQILYPFLDNTFLLVLVLVLGFVFLLLGARGLIDGASNLAKRLGVSNLVIGLTVVALGTSMPEFVINMLSVAEGQTDLALTNIVGSNIINVFVILGLTALVYPITSTESVRSFDIPLNILANVVLLCAVIITLPFESVPGMSRLSGAILLLFFVIFMYHSVKTAKIDEADEENKMPVSLFKSAVYIFCGLLGLVIGGEMIVRGSVRVAVELGVPDAIIGLTIVAIGSSLPELATSVIAATRHNCDLALGNIIGSIAFNLCFILGVSALLKPLPVYKAIIIDCIMVTAGTVLLGVGILSNRQYQLKRWHGAFFLIIYAVYLTYRLVNQ